MPVCRGSSIAQHKGVDKCLTVWQSLGMDTMTPRQRDIDRRLRDATGMTLEAWLTRQRDDRASYHMMTLALHQETGDSVSYETLRTWARSLTVDAA